MKKSKSKKSAAHADTKIRALREQRMVVDELVAQLTLSPPETAEHFKERLQTERRVLDEMESEWRGRPKSNLIHQV
ncbi:MAG: hypothetical protein ABSC71_12200 [Candidatus Acidiferrales bacterium]